MYFTSLFWPLRFYVLRTYTDRGHLIFYLYKFRFYLMVITLSKQKTSQRKTANQAGNHTQDTNQIGTHYHVHGSCIEIDGKHSNLRKWKIFNISIGVHFLLFLFRNRLQDIRNYPSRFCCLFFHPVFSFVCRLFATWSHLRNEVFLAQLITRFWDENVQPLESENK